MGEPIPFRGEDLRVQLTEASAFRNQDFVFFSAGASRSREFIPHAIQEQAYVIDNSSAFRMQSDVPLVVPEVNGHLLTTSTHLIANPNCTAALLLMTLAPLRKLGQLSRVIVSTYQSASGAGAQAMEELRSQTRCFLDGEPVVPNILPHPYAFNLFSHNTPIGDDGANEEEAKVVEETRKILDDSRLPMNVTCVRVPVLRAHSESVTVEFAGERPSLEAVREAWAAMPGVQIVDDRAANLFPMPISASGGDDVLVGRLRNDPSHENAISYFLAGDQLLKGAALNAVQIAESLAALR